MESAISPARCICGSCRGGGAAAAAVFVGWLEGYTSAYNRLSDDTFDVVPIVEGALIAALVRNVCTRNPDAAIEAVLARVLRDLEPHRIRSESPIVTARAGDRSIALRQETLRRAQVRLAEKGHYRMAPDGLFGQGTQSALAAYQQAEGLAVTGLPDADTLARLILSSR